MKHEQKQLEKNKKISFSKENPTFYKILVIVGIITAVLNALIADSGDFISLIFFALGFISSIIIISWIIGMLPVLILRNKIKNARIKIYGMIFLLLCILIVLGNLEEYGEQNIKLMQTDKSDYHSEQDGNLYRNTKYNFRIKFPEEWDIKSGDGPNILQKAVKGNHTISIGVREIPEEHGDKTATIKDVMSIMEFKDTLLEGIQEKFSGAKLIDYGESKLDNNPTYWVKYIAPYTVLDITVQGTHLQYQVLNNNILYTISAGSTSDEFDTIESDFMKSIATFVIEDY